MDPFGIDCSIPGSFGSSETLLLAAVELPVTSHSTFSTCAVVAFVGCRRLPKVDLAPCSYSCSLVSAVRLLVMAAPFWSAGKEDI